MKKILVLLIIFLSAFAGIAQNDSNRNKERNIKTTDLYLYGEATADTPKEATQLAKKILLSRIFDFEPGLINNSGQIEKIIEKSDQYLSMERGIKFRTVAFYLKSEVQNLAKSAPQEKPKEVTVNNETPQLKVVAEKKDEAPKIAEETLAKKDSLIVVQPEKLKLKKESETMPKDTAQTLAPAGPVKSDFSDGKELLKYILSIDDARQLKQLFDDQKQKGMLIYGGKNTLSFPDKCYIVVYTRDGAVKAYLDKGTSSRKNMISGKTESLNLYEGNPYIWFQVMD